VAAVVVAAGGSSVYAAGPAAPRVISVTELGPITQNEVIRGRDGAQSALVDGRPLWTFGDTILSVPGHDGDSWADNTLSWTDDLDASDGITLTGDHLDATGAPTEFLPFTSQERRFNALHDPRHCQQEPCGAELALWAGPVVPDPLRDRVLFFYMKLYRVAGHPGWRTIGTGIAVQTGGGPVTRPIEDPVGFDPTLMFQHDEVGFGSGSVMEGDTLYSYGCFPGFLVQHCELGRVSLGDALDRSAWAFYAGGGSWSSNIGDAITVFEGGAANEVWFDQALGRYLAVYSQPLSDDVMMRTADQLWGPWSDQTKLFTGVAGRGFDYAALAHPEYARDGGRTQYVTYVRSPAPFNLEIRLVEVVFG
jgi:hypothetical protein